jgi:hypothetical protein
MIGCHKLLSGHAQTKLQWLYCMSVQNNSKFKADRTYNLGSSFWLHLASKLEALLGRTVIGTHNGHQLSDSSDSSAARCGRCEYGSSSQSCRNSITFQLPSASGWDHGIGVLFWMGCCSKWWLCQPTHLVTLSTELIEPWIWCPMISAHTPMLGKWFIHNRIPRVEMPFENDKIWCSMCSLQFAPCHS